MTFSKLNLINVGFNLRCSLSDHIDNIVNITTFQDTYCFCFLSIGHEWYDAIL